jgi:hypothetical protein
MKFPPNTVSGNGCAEQAVLRRFEVTEGVNSLRIFRVLRTADG